MFKGSGWFWHQLIKTFLGKRISEVSSLLSIYQILLCCDNKATNPPSGEYALHHNNKIIDANLAKNVSSMN